MPAGETSRNVKTAGPVKQPRTSIRQSLNFMTVGKAFADVMNQDNQGSKARRSSVKPIAPRPSLGDLPSTTKRSGSPDSTVHRRRTSAIATRPRQSADELGFKEDEKPAATITRSATLRARPPVAGSGSALPKYRPKATKAEGTKTSSPLKAGVRRKLSGSDEDKSSISELQASCKDDLDKDCRPISPLPQRATRRTASAPKAESQARQASATPVKSKSTPTRPAKIHKTSGSTATTKSFPGPGSVASSSSSSRPQTPTKKSASQPSKDKVTAPLKSSPLRKTDSAPRVHKPPSTNGVYSQVAPRTPTRSTKRGSKLLKGAVLVPLPSDISPRRPPLEKDSPSGPRGSILSWEDLANEASRTLGEEEVQNMLNETNAPFRSRTGSPSLSYTSLTYAGDFPDSPALSRFNSPAAFHSISSVLLPDVTPSPAAHANRSLRLDDAVNLSTDSAQATLLRLQLVSVEQTAKERLNRLQTLEVELDQLKQARHQETEQLTAQVGQLERQIRGKLDSSMRMDEQQMAHISSLEEQMLQADLEHEAAVALAVDQAEKQSKAFQMDKLSSAISSWNLLYVSQGVAATWSTATNACHQELETIQNDRQVIDVLLSQLELLQTGLTRC